MGMPRAARKKAVVISSDEEDGLDHNQPPSELSEDDRPPSPSQRSSGKPQPRKKSVKASTTNVNKEEGPRKSPKKAKIPAAKGKTAVTEPPKPAAKPIYSFFNAATQRLKPPQTPLVSPDKRPVHDSQDEPEAIHDDSDGGDGSDLQLAKGSSTALAVRKRKVHHEGSFENESGLLPSASQKFRKTSSGDRVPSLSVFNNDKRPWTEQFQPNEISELAVHKRKIDDVRKWLEMTLNGHRQRVLVLKGGAGTGKTTTIRLLADALGLRTSEWRNPAGGEFASESSASTAMQFNEFIARAGRAGGLQFTTADINDGDVVKVPSLNGTATSSESDGQLLLIEEFPNTFSRTSSTLQSFRSAILQYLSTPPMNNAKPTPVIMVISETLLSTATALSDSFTSHRLLGPELSNHPFLDTIEFNPVAPTIMMKALESVVLKEARKTGRRRTPGPQVLKRLAESGDIRSAISSLEFLCLRNDGEEMWSSKVTFTKQKKSKSDPPLTQAEEEALKLISNRETTLDIFHAVGKVVYNKRIEAPSIPHPPPWFPDHRRNTIPENDVDILVDEVGTDASTFLAALHENYALSCSRSSLEGTLDSILGCVENLSDADLLSVDRFSYGTRAFSGSATDSLRQDEMAFQVSVRGIWFNLPFPVHRSMPPDGKKGDAHRMFYPASLRLWRKREEVESVLDALLTRLQPNNVESSSANTSETAASGVASWKRSNTMDGLPDADSLVDTSGARTNSVKVEMVLERLPYMARITTKNKIPQKMIDQLNTVTRIQTSTLARDDDDAELDEKEESNPEQWATDRPDIEAEHLSRGVKAKQKPDRGKLSGSRGRAIPMEGRVEALVLEDDDIVDD